MKIRPLAVLFTAVLSSLFTFAADLVAKFSSLDSGAKSGAFTIGENGRTITSEASWLVSDGVTVVVEYSGFAVSSGNAALVSLKQSNKDQKNLIGIGTKDGKFYGVYNGSIWSNVTTGSDVPASGTLVFSYNNNGVVVYTVSDGEKVQVYAAGALKETKDGFKLGTSFDIGALNAGTLSAGITVSKVLIYNVATAADDVVTVATSTSDDITLPNGTYTVSHVLSGAGAVTVDAGANGIITLGAANTFTGGLTVKSGTLKTTNATGYGPNNWQNVANLATIAVEEGATLDLGNTKDSCYSITSAGTITNSGAEIGSGSRQTMHITLNGNTTVSGNQFGLLGPNYAATTLNLDEYTLTVNMASATTTFILCNCTVSGSGKIRLEQGKLYLKKAISGTLNIDLPAVPTDGATLLSLDNDRNLDNMTLNVTVDGAALPKNVTVSKEGVVTVRPESSPIVRDDAAKTWTLDTTDAAYTLESSEIAELKGSAITFTISGTNENGATIDLGSNTTSQKAHYVFASGTHTLKWAAGNLSNGSLDFDTTGTDENPSILVKSGATLNFYAKDVTGWKHDAKDAKTTVIKVESGATLKLYKNGNNTWFFQGRFIIEPGATVEAVDFEANKFCLNGGSYADYQQLYVPAPAEGATSIATYTSNVGFRFAADTTIGYAALIEDGATLQMNGQFTTADTNAEFGKYGEGVLELTGNVGPNVKFVLGGGAIKMKSACARQDGKIRLADDVEGELKETTDGEWIIYEIEPPIQFDPEKDVVAETPVLRFSEIMPKPSDKPYSITTQAGYDKNGLESGWVELENTSDKWVDLGDYKFCRANRGKVYTHADYGNFPSGTYIPPHGRYTFYTSERYANSYPEAKDGNTSAFQHGTFDGKPVYYPEYNMMIWGDKVNPKKFPYVTLVYRPEEATEDTILETVIIPSDTPEGYSIIVGHDEGEGEATKRWLCPTPTKNAANSDTTELVKIGPNVGSVYGTAKSVSEFAATAPAKIGEAYPVSLNVNPVYNAAGPREADKITAVTLVYRTKLGKGVSGEVPMTKSGTNDGGDIWTAEIPAADIPSEPGQLIQWKTKITDAASNTWTSPSFMNKDDGYEWFGTITEPDELNSANLPTWHMFADDLSLKWMDTDTDAQSTTEIPNKARVAIYDASTSIYHDYVRIDLRGNTSSHFTKKSHGLRFSKVNPLTMKDAVQGGEVKEIRKSSLIGEPADPSFMRQMIAFWLWNKMGNKVPFDFPVRCNLNGDFFQLAFHSERFTDELIEDFHKLDKYGYGYKNVGTLKTGSGTTAGGIEKKTPDDGNESDVSKLQNELRKPLADLGIDGLSAKDNAERPAVTKFVVEKFNLPAWLNYLASARITQEMDDVWANISMYCDDPQMLEGARGTGTWMPLGYDFNLTFGQWYYNDVGSGSGLMANQDWFKSHPFYGGNVVRCYKQAAMTSTCNEGNRGLEAVLQSPKFRRLYLRRLRTLMDQELKAPGTDEADVPFMAKMRELAELMEADAVLDQKKWPHSSSNTGAIDVWRNGVSWPATMSAGIDDIWNNYVVPRQTHLYVTHAAEGHDSDKIGYGSTLCAGIPAAQSSLDKLKEGLSVATVDGGIVIRNTNAEAIDLSGWDVSGPVVMKLPAGTVIDEGTEENPGEVFVVTDRVAYIAANDESLTDEVIIGNAKAGSGTDIGLTAADGTIIISADVILSPGTYSDVSYDVPVRLAPAGEFEFAGVSFNGGLALGDGDYTLKNKNGFVNSASVVEAPTANITFSGKGTFQLLGAKESGALMTVNNLIVGNGVVYVESKATTSGTNAVVVNGNFSVEDKGTVTLKLTKNAAQGCGIFMASKNMKCEISSVFNATLNGPGCRAIQIDKGSVNLEIKTGAKVSVDATGADARVFKGKGNIKIYDGTVSASATGAGSEIFSADKAIEISGGEMTLTSSDDCFNAATTLTVSGGTINGTSTSGDVFDSNGTMSITGGSIVGLAIGSESDGKSGQVFDVNEPNVVDFTDSTATIFAISGIDATLGVETTAADISGQTIKEWTAPEITGVETVKLFMMINGQKVMLESEETPGFPAVEPTEDGIVVAPPAGADSIVIESDDVEVAEGATAIPFTTGVYTITAKKDGAVVSEETLGVINVEKTETATTRAVAVAFEGTTVENLLNTALLAQGDTLQAYITVGGKTGYAKWTLNADKEWVGEDIQLGILAQPATTALQRGTGVWVTTAGKIVTFGKYTEPTAITPGEGTSFLGNINLASDDVSNLVDSTNDGDQIYDPAVVAVPSNKVNGEWVHTEVDTSGKFPVSKKVKGAKVKVGHGFFYVRPKSK